MRVQATPIGQPYHTKDNMAEITDLKLAYTALQSKQAPYTILWSYYNGDQPLRYSTERLREVFRDLSARFTQNWCSVVVNASLDRMNLLRFSIANDERSSDRANELWTTTEMTLDDVDVHLAALVIGESFVVVWPNEEGAVEAYYNDPRNCHLFYETTNPRKKRMGCKWWVGDEGERRLTLYYPDRLEYYASAQKADQISSSAALRPAEPPSAPNPYGEIPIFHLRRERRSIESELANLVPLQDAINKLLADMMVAAEFGAFRQRWVITNADTKTLKNAPNEIWQIPAGDTMSQGSQVGEFGQTDLGVYLGAMDKLATSIAVISRTPKHYFFDAGGDPSGEALIVMEAPLTHKVETYIERFSHIWRKVMAFMLRVDGITVDEWSIEPQFDDPATIQPYTQAQIRLTNGNAGIPLRTQLRQEGWSEDELAMMDKDKADESAAGAASFGAAMAEAARRASAGETEV